MKLACFEVFDANAQYQKSADESFIEHRDICFCIPFDQFFYCLTLDFNFFGYTDINWIPTRLIILI